jgi:hypothetical protein
MSIWASRPHLIDNRNKADNIKQTVKILFFHDIMTTVNDHFGARLIL